MYMDEVRAVPDDRVFARRYFDADGRSADVIGVGGPVASFDDVLSATHAAADGSDAVIHRLEDDAVDLQIEPIGGASVALRAADEAVSYERIVVDRDALGDTLVAWTGFFHTPLRVYDPAGVPIASTLVLDPTWVCAAVFADDGTGDVVVVTEDDGVLVIERRAADLVTVRWTDRTVYPTTDLSCATLGVDPDGIVVVSSRDSGVEVRVLAP